MVSFAITKDKVGRKSAQGFDQRLGHAPSREREVKREAPTRSVTRNPLQRIRVIPHLRISGTLKLRDFSSNSIVRAEGIPPTSQDNQGHREASRDPAWNVGDSS